MPLFSSSILKNPAKRKSFIYLICFIIIIPVGLCTRWYGANIPPVIAKYAGDVLYATCWFFFIRIWLPKPPVWKIALYAWIICICIETLQLYQAPWTQKLRHIQPFGLILGYGFLWSDWLCYAVGALLGWGIGKMIEPRFTGI